MTLVRVYHASDDTTFRRAPLRQYYEMRTPLSAIHGNAQLVLEALHIYEEMPDATTRFPRIPSFG